MWQWWVRRSSMAVVALPGCPGKEFGRNAIRAVKAKSGGATLQERCEAPKPGCERILPPIQGDAEQKAGGAARIGGDDVDQNADAVPRGCVRHGAERGLVAKRTAHLAM